MCTKENDRAGRTSTAAMECEKHMEELDFRCRLLMAMMMHKRGQGPRDAHVAAANIRGNLVVIPQRR